MTGTLPLSCGWRLSGDGAAGPVSFLPGAERLPEYADLLPVPEEEGRAFPLPGLLPEGEELRLSRGIPFGTVRCGFAELRFACLRGSGAVLLDGREIARFSDGPLTLDLSEAARAGRTANLTLAFDRARPAGITGGVFLHCAGSAAIVSASFSFAGSGIRGEVRVSGRAGKYRLAAATGGNGAAGRSETEFTMEGDGVKTVPVSLRFSGEAGSATVAVSVSRVTERGRQLPCDRRVSLACRADRPQAWLPLAREETWEDPDALAEKLSALRIPAVSLPAPAQSALASALARRGIGLLPPPAEPEGDYKGSASSGADPFREEAFGDTPGSLARQLCGFTACPVSPPPVSLPEEAMLRAAFGALPADAEALREPMLRLLVRLRAEGAQRSLYSGPVAPPGALSDPVLSTILQSAAAPHAAALPLAGGWWCGSSFSCRLFLTGAPSGSRGEAALRDAGGRIFARLSWRDGEMPVLTARLPDVPCRLALSLTLFPPEGQPVAAPDLPVFAGRRGPLEAMLSGPEAIWG